MAPRRNNITWQLRLWYSGMSRLHFQFLKDIIIEIEKPIGEHVNGKDLVLQLRCATWSDNISWSKTGLVDEGYCIVFIYSGILWSQSK